MECNPIFVSTIKKKIKMTYTASQIETLAQGKKVQTIIPSKFSEVEYLVVKLDTFVSAYFLMDNTTFNYTYSHTYNAAKDTKTKRLPKGF
jgi:hypothetical protein